VPHPSLIAGRQLAKINFSATDCPSRIRRMQEKLFSLEPQARNHPYMGPLLGGLRDRMGVRKAQSLGPSKLYEGVTNPAVSAAERLWFEAHYGVSAEEAEKEASRVAKQAADALMSDSPDLPLDAPIWVHIMGVDGYC